MTEQEVADLGPAFAAYLRRFCGWVLSLVGQKFVAEVSANFTVRHSASGEAHRLVWCVT